MAQGIAVVNLDGGRIRPGQAWKRACTRVILSCIPVVSLIDVLMVFSRERTTLHDRLAATRVVRI